MKKLLFILLSVVFIVSCENKEEDPKPIVKKNNLGKMQIYYYCELPGGSRLFRDSIESGCFIMPCESVHTEIFYENDTIGGRGLFVTFIPGSKHYAMGGTPIGYSLCYGDTTNMIHDRWF